MKNWLRKLTGANELFERIQKLEKQQWVSEDACETTGYDPFYSGLLVSMYGAPNFHATPENLYRKIQALADAQGKKFQKLDAKTCGVKYKAVPKKAKRK